MNKIHLVPGASSMLLLNGMLFSFILILCGLATIGPCCLPPKRQVHLYSENLGSQEQPCKKWLRLSGAGPMSTAALSERMDVSEPRGIVTFSVPEVQHGRRCWLWVSILGSISLLSWLSPLTLSFINVRRWCPSTCHLCLSYPTRPTRSLLWSLARDSQELWFDSAEHHPDWWLQARGMKGRTRTWAPC